VATPQPVSVRILDVSGRLVRQVRDNEVLKVGRHSLDWDGTDRNGNEAPSGVYLVQVAAGGSVDSRRVTLVR
ncbi:MAG: T9SS type A sorting domain-containing protein, partial [Candidatus Eisenbacteria bacterium]|nr:T9SS type A sorting domain-containing protein [Candidatus Eisenbacteria bacterium]